MTKAGFRAITGDYGSGKTNYAMRILKEVVANRPGVYGFTDIKEYIPEPKHGIKNIFHVNSVEQIEATDQDKKNGYTYEYSLVYILELMYQVYEERENRGEVRDKRPQFYIFLDEAGVVFDKYDINQKSISKIKQYIRQIRKLNGVVFLVLQEHNDMALTIRGLISQEYYNLPLFGIDARPFNLFSEVRIKQIDPETSQTLIKKTWSNWSRERFDVPQDFHFQYYYRPSIRKFYNDLYINIKIKNRPVLPKNYQKYLILIIIDYWGTIRYSSFDKIFIYIKKCRSLLISSLKKFSRF